MAKDWIAYWMARGETAERAAYLAKGSEALASHAVFRVVEIDQEGCQCDAPEREKCAHTFNVSVYSTRKKPQARRSVFFTILFCAMRGTSASVAQKRIGDYTLSRR